MRRRRGPHGAQLQLLDRRRRTQTGCQRGSVAPCPSSHHQQIWWHERSLRHVLGNRVVVGIACCRPCHYLRRSAGSAPSAPTPRRDLPLQPLQLAPPPAAAAAAAAAPFAALRACPAAAVAAKSLSAALSLLFVLSANAAAGPAADIQGWRRSCRQPSPTRQRSGHDHAKTPCGTPPN